MFGWMITTYNIDIHTIGLPFDCEYKKFGKYKIVRKHNGRFKNDTLFEEDDRYIVIIDGVVLNRTELEDTYEKSFYEIVQMICNESVSLLPTKLRGSFSGAIISKKDDSITFFTNHTGEACVFYCVHEENFMIGNNYKWMVALLKNFNVNYKLDNNAVKYMCTFGYMLDACTYINIIKRLLPSNLGILNKNKFQIIEYHKFNNYDTCKLSEEDYIENLDQLFRQAIRREFDKDKEYGYTSIVDLSGGLDSRVINYVAKDMGYDNILNVSFSQTFSDEYKATIALSRDLGFKLFHYPLDNATHLYDVDKIVSNTGGLSFYAGVGALMSLMENINLNNYGLEHGGILGEMADGVFPGKWYDKHIPPTFKDGMPFGKTIDINVLDDNILDRFKNLELFTIFGRGMMGGACTILARREYTGYAMAFGDVDFYDFFLSIPVKIRQSGILKKWINKKYPQAFNIIEDKLMCKPNAKPIVLKYHIFKRKLKSKFTDYFGKYIPKLAMNSMNPFAYWYDHNEQLRMFVNDYYNDNIAKLEPYPESKELVEKVFYEGNIVEKFLAMTVLSAVKLFI